MTANKIFAAILVAMLTGIAASHLAHHFVHPHMPEHTAFHIDTSAFEGEGGETVVVSVVPIANRLATADAGRGEQRVGLCAGCHSFTEGGADGTGPNLWGIVGRDIASKDGFTYSAALRGLDGNWDYEALDAYLESPANYAPGNAMAFIGVSNADRRADIIAYLRSLSNDPLPLPEPEVVEEVNDIMDAVTDEDAAGHE